jgi:hypothetical protein
MIGKMPVLLALLGACGGPPRVRSPFVGTWQGDATVDTECPGRPMNSGSDHRGLVVVIEEAGPVFSVAIDGCTASATPAPDDALAIESGCASMGGRVLLKEGRLAVVYATAVGPCTETTRGELTP